MLVDIDKFKSINDTVEEFVIIIPRSKLAAAEQLRTSIAAAPFQAPGETMLKVTASVGVSQP